MSGPNYEQVEELIGVLCRIADALEALSACVHTEKNGEKYLRIEKWL